VLAYWRRYSDAIAPLQKAAELAPTVSRNHTTLGMCWAQLGKVAQAEAEYRKAPPDDIYRLTGEAILFDRQGNRAASNQAVQRAQKVFGDAASYQYAEIYAQRGDKEGAFAALNRAWAIHDPGLTTLRVDPYLDPLRGDPRFQAMEKRLNFPAA
jgi:tetratricopeptide (TPR) repeat protein